MCMSNLFFKPTVLVNSNHTEPHGVGKVDLEWLYALGKNSFNGI